MTKEEFKPYFDMFPKGNFDRAWSEAQYHHISKGIPYQTIVSKWKEYLDCCQTDKKDEQYIMQLEKFIEKKEYESNFKVTLKLGFLNKYKKK